MYNGVSTIPRHLQRRLKEYLLPNEKTLDAIKEVFTFDIDFRWIVVSNGRVILVTRRYFDYIFRDFPIDKIDVDIDLGFIFDELVLMIPGKQYKAQFFVINRARTLEFFGLIKKLISSSRDREGNAIIKSARNEDFKRIQMEEVALDLKTLKNLADKGIITWMDFEKKKKELLKRL